MQGIKNDAYEDNVLADCDSLVLNASTNPEKLSDLTIRVSATHTPGNNSL